MIYVPHGRSPSMWLMKGNSISAWIQFHLQIFARKFLRWLLEEAGFNPQILQITQINSIRIYEYNPTSWLPKSIVQWRNQKQARTKYRHSRLITLTCYPIGWFVAKCGMGEEMVGIGIVA
jgi:hypothetical protein